MTRTTPSHRLFLPDLDEADGPVSLGGEEAHHAVRVKRLRPGEAVELFDGRGRVLVGRVLGSNGSRANPELAIEPVGEVEPVEPVRPQVEICCPAPKGDRVERMLDQLSQAGAARWRPLVCEHSEEIGVRRSTRLERVIVESAKQCGRAYLLEMGDPISFGSALEHPRVLVADREAGATPAVRTTGEVRVLVGPEGGWSAEEFDRVRGMGVPMLPLGPHVLRLETAAVLAAAFVLAASRER